MKTLRKKNVKKKGQQSANVSLKGRLLHCMWTRPWGNLKRSAPGVTAVCAGFLGVFHTDIFTMLYHGDPYYFLALFTKIIIIIITILSLSLMHRPRVPNELVIFTWRKFGKTKTVCLKWLWVIAKYLIWYLMQDINWLFPSLKWQNTKIKRTNL